MSGHRGRDRPGDAALIGGLLAVDALYRLRAAQGVLGLADTHGSERLEAACAKALAVGDPGYRTVKGILIAGTETDPPPARGTVAAASAPAHLRGPPALAPADPAAATPPVGEGEAAS